MNSTKLTKNDIINAKEVIKDAADRASALVYEIRTILEEAQEEIKNDYKESFRDYGDKRAIRTGKSIKSAAVKAG